MIGKIKAHIARPMDRFGVEMTLYVEKPDGTYDVGQLDAKTGEFVYSPHKPGAMIPEKVRIKLGHEEAEAIFEGLLGMFDPPKKAATEEKLEATERHLSTIGAILEMVLPSALREKAETFQAKRNILAAAISPYQSSGNSGDDGNTI